jgi:hypothetical protein
MQVNTNNESGELVLYSPPECPEGIFCYYKQKACIYKHDGQNTFIVNKQCEKGDRCKFINQLCNLKHSLDKRIRGYINPDLVCSKRHCKSFEVNDCKKLHICDYNEFIKYVFTFRNINNGIWSFMNDILPKMNADRIMKKMGLHSINQLAPPMDSRERYPDRHRSRSNERHSDRHRSRSRERRSDRHRSGSRERRSDRERSRSRERDLSRSRKRDRSRSRDRFISHSYTSRLPEPYQRPPEPYQRLPDSYQRPSEPYQRPHESYQRPSEPYQVAHHPYQAPPQYYQEPPQLYQGPPQLYQGPPQPYQVPPQPYQGPPQSYQSAPLGVELSTRSHKRVITVQPKKTDIHSLLQSAVNDGKNKIINNVNDFNTKCRNVPSCHLHNFKACKYMHKDQIDECLALYETTKDIKLVQDLAKKMMDGAQSRFKNSTPQKSSTGRYFDTAPDYLPL